jgi:hypothetical protein
MSLITRVALPPTVTVVFPPRGKLTPLRVRSRVVRSNKVQAGFYDVGVQFLRLDSTAK